MRRAAANALASISSFLVPEPDSRSRKCHTIPFVNISITFVEKEMANFVGDAKALPIDGMRLVNSKDSTRSISDEHG